MSFRYSNTISFGTFRDVVYVINESTQRIYQFNQVAAAFWQAIPQYESFEDIVSFLLLRYDVDRECLQKDLQVLFDKLIGYGIIETQPINN